MEEGTKSLIVVGVGSEGRQAKVIATNLVDYLAIGGVSSVDACEAENEKSSFEDVGADANGVLGPSSGMEVDVAIRLVAQTKDPARTLLGMGENQIVTRLKQSVAIAFQVQQIELLQMVDDPARQVARRQGACVQIHQSRPEDGEARTHLDEGSVASLTDVVNASA